MDLKLNKVLEVTGVKPIRIVKYLDYVFAIVKENEVWIFMENLNKIRLVQMLIKRGREDNFVIWMVNVFRMWYKTACAPDMIMNYLSNHPC